MGAALEETFYNVPVTPGELWQRVGTALAEARRARKWKPIDVQKHDGPTYKTVQVIEAGDVGTVDSLEKYADALGLSIVDVLQSVLATTVTPLTPEAAQVVRQFTETTVDGRSALLAVANALPRAAVTTGTPPIPAAAAAPGPSRPPRPGPRAATPRKPR